ncbi:diguanylate cyclase (GGDEF) domain-containing protein [Amphritea atlantica]|uniref:cyclic-guanylate-specific phosphodiesterase n=1 Tax=Amphritea atlantica TaxID=355243 RepID=A0A1H9ECI9_9GAMM|nr:EAL domain-containing protein [Amphritea atlantica]SEQ23375.1 diguanylate cyclase (GGDEF) domain-containing protein [Amphritea atlantica]
MSIFKRLPLQRKLMSMLLLISSTVLTLATAGFALHDWYDSRLQATENLRSQADIISTNSIAALTFGDAESARVTLESLDNVQDIVLAVLYDADKKLFAKYAPGNFPVPTLPTSSEGEIDGALYVLRPVMMDHDAIGYTLLLSDLGSLTTRQADQIGIAFIVFLLSLIVALLLSSVAQLIITRPITELAMTVRKITRTRNYQLRVRNRSEDEIGSLATDFNLMIEQIQARDNQLEQARQLLEEKVKDRTAELLLLTQQLEHQAFHDSLTGLPNRATFDNNLNTAIHYAQRSNEQLAVMFLDLDRFKDINDTLGHEMGDRLLVELSARLQHCLRSSDTLARLGGDEFAVLTNNTSQNRAADIATKLIRTIQTPVDIDGFNLQVTTSLGISIYPADGDDATTIVKHADTAMYYSKAAGRNQFSFFAKEMNIRSERRIHLAQKLRQAIEEQRFEVYYQPKWCIRRNVIVGLEALIRWFDADEGAIPPDEFIPLAEDQGLIGLVDQWVIKKACADILQVRQQFGEHIQLSVNFSPAHFIRRDLYKRIAEILTETGFPGESLELEITETFMATENEQLLEQLNQIRSLGVEISIDDFGIAYSSLSRLKRLPLNTLKIDRSFIRDIGSDRDDEVIVKTIIDMAHNLNLKVVAEGVETREQLAFVRHHNCDQVQGFLFSPPVPLEQLICLMEQQESLVQA